MVESLQQGSAAQPAVMELGLRGRHMAWYGPANACAPTGVGALRRMATRETQGISVALVCQRMGAASKFQETRR